MKRVEEESFLGDPDSVPDPEAAAAAAAAVKRLLERWRAEHRQKAKQAEEKLVGPGASEAERLLARVIAHETVVSERLAEMEAVMLAQLMAFIESPQSDNFRHVAGLLKETFVLRGHGARRLKEYCETLSVLAVRRGRAVEGRQLRLVR